LIARRIAQDLRLSSSCISPGPSAPHPSGSAAHPVFKSPNCLCWIYRNSRLETNLPYFLGDDHPRNSPTRIGLIDSVHPGVETLGSDAGVAMSLVSSSTTTLEVVCDVTDAHGNAGPLSCLSRLPHRPRSSAVAAVNIVLCDKRQLVVPEYTTEEARLPGPASP
jgi:hypothetical protein